MSCRLHVGIKAWGRNSLADVLLGQQEGGLGGSYLNLRTQKEGKGVGMGVGMLQQVQGMQGWGWKLGWGSMQQELGVPHQHLWQRGKRVGLLQRGLGM